MSTRQGIAATIAVVAVLVGTPALAQFEEPDTVPRFSIGPFVELSFRGLRGEFTEDRPGNIGLGNGPAFGARVEYRIGRTVSLGVAGSRARTEEKTETGGSSDALFFGDMTVYHVLGEVLFRVKPSVPGYFVLGGGMRFVDPDPFDPDDPGGTVRFTREDNYTEPLFTTGVGLEFTGGRRIAVRFDIRFYISLPADLADNIDSNSLASDFALGGVLLYRM